MAGLLTVLLLNYNKIISIYGWITELTLSIRMILEFALKILKALEAKSGTWCSFALCVALRMLDSNRIWISLLSSARSRTICREYFILDQPSSSVNAEHDLLTNNGLLIIMTLMILSLKFLKAFNINDALDVITSNKVGNTMFLYYSVLCIQASKPEIFPKIY